MDNPDISSDIATIIKKYNPVSDIENALTLIKPYLEKNDLVILLQCQTQNWDLDRMSKSLLSFNSVIKTIKEMKIKFGMALMKPVASTGISFKSKVFVALLERNIYVAVTVVLVKFRLDLLGCTLSYLLYKLYQP
jgi:hypothetical protein